MNFPYNIKATADDLALRPSVNEAILHCYKNGYINSTSLLTNTIYFGDTINLIRENNCIINIGVHVNLAEGKPVSSFNQQNYLDENGNWDIQKTNKKFIILNKSTKIAFFKEICAQIDKALSVNISVVHLDSHYHLHTLPCFYNLFLQAAKQYKLKLRLAQTYNEGNYIKFLYRKYINNKFKLNNNHYSDYFETVNRFLKNNKIYSNNEVVEIMLHPDLDPLGKLTDHFDPGTLSEWIIFLEK